MDAKEEVGFTPGPWRLEQSPRWPFRLTIIAGDDRIVGANGLYAVSTADRSAEDANAREGNAECLANAALKAAAPDIYKELAHLVRLIEPLEEAGAHKIPGLATLNGARRALAKARGEQ